MIAEAVATKHISLAGHRFGLLTVLGRAERKPGTVHRLSWYRCRCDCGNELSVRRDDLTVGRKHRCDVCASKVRQRPPIRFCVIDSRAGEKIRFGK